MGAHQAVGDPPGGAGETAGPHRALHRSPWVGEGESVTEHVFSCQDATRGLGETRI